MTTRLGQWVRNGWVAAGASAVVVVGVVAGVQLATDGEPGAVPPAASVGAPAHSIELAPVPTAGGSIAAAAELFGPAGGTAEGQSDVVRSSPADLAAPWPLHGCAEAAAPEAGRVDFVGGTERGPEYGRDLAIGWYADAATAEAAYDGLLSTLETCATAAGRRLTVDAANLGSASSIVTIASAATTQAAGEQSTYAVALTGAVVVLAGDHAVSFAATGASAPAAFEGTSQHAERLLSEACRVGAGRCG